MLMIVLRGGMAFWCSERARGICRSDLNCYGGMDKKRKWHGKERKFEKLCTFLSSFAIIIGRRNWRMLRSTSRLNELGSMERQ